MITEHLRAAGRAINYRHAAMRWFEYALFVAVLGIGIVGVARYESWDYRIAAGIVFTLAGLIALMSATLYVRSVEQDRAARRLQRAHDRRRKGE